ncbi:hypothetical protein CL634_06280 [bacterium]|nr:hypothetical protein [bacterium]|tara:strand:+ start:375 stop:665 length:291 start_codon:yes stop_codon:yes gene_type:complete
MSKKEYSDFESKKTVHFNITRESHTSLRMICFKHRLSMQEVFEEISQRIAAESSDMILLMEDMSERKKNKLIKKLSETDAQSLYNIIEEDNPVCGG